MDLLQSSWILAFVFAFVLYGSGKLESHGGLGKGLLWAALSVAISLIVIRVFGECAAQMAHRVALARLRRRSGPDLRRYRQTLQRERNLSGSESRAAASNRPPSPTPDRSPADLNAA